LALTDGGVKDLQAHRIIARQIRETNLAHDFHINYENLSLENRRLLMPVESVEDSENVHRNK
jgi:hypothetical protein